MFGKTNVDLAKELTSGRLKLIQDINKVKTSSIDKKNVVQLTTTQSRSFFNKVASNVTPFVVLPSGAFAYLAQGGITAVPKLTWGQKTFLFAKAYNTPAKIGKLLRGTAGLGIEYFIKSPARGYNKIMTSNLVKELSKDKKGLNALFGVQISLNKIKEGRGTKKDLERINKSLTTINKIDKGKGTSIVKDLIKDPDVQALSLLTTFALVGTTVIGSKIVLKVGQAATVLAAGRVAVSPSEKNLQELLLFGLGTAFASRSFKTKPTTTFTSKVPRSGSYSKPNTVWVNEKTGTIRVSDSTGKVFTAGNVKTVKGVTRRNIKRAVSQAFDQKKTFRSKPEVAKREASHQVKKLDEQIAKDLRGSKPTQSQLKDLGFKNQKEYQLFRDLQLKIRSNLGVKRNEARLDSLTQRINKRVLVLAKQRGEKIRLGKEKAKGRREELKKSKGRQKKNHTT